MLLPDLQLGLPEDNENLPVISFKTLGVLSCKTPKQKQCVRPAHSSFRMIVKQVTAVKARTNICSQGCSVVIANVSPCISHFDNYVWQAL